MNLSPNEQGKTLELAADYLRQVRLQLIRCDSVQEQTVPALERIAHLLAGVRSSSDAPLENVGARGTLVAIQTLAARTQLLLDAAANFHCGAALASPGIAESYAPDGTWETIYPSDQIRLNA